MGSPRSLHLAVQTEALAYLTSGLSIDLVGVAGSGRSHVLAEVRRALLDADWTTLTVRGIAALRDRPLEPLAVAGLTARADRRAPSAVAGAVAAIEDAVRPGRTLLVVDDVDDLDPASSGAVAAAHARSELVVLSASRPLPARLHDPHRLVAEVRPGIEIQMPALGYVDTQTLVADLLPGPIDSVTVRRIYSASGGLPGLATAITDDARRHGRIRRVDGTWAAEPDLWSPTLARSVAPLVQDLSPDALDGLEALSLAGPVEVRVARTLVSWDVLEELDQCRLLRFLPRGTATVVGVFPEVVGAYFRNLGTSVRSLRIDERHRVALQVAGSEPPGAPPLAAVGPTAAVDHGRAAGNGAPWETDTVRHRMLVEHWYRETLARRAEWETARSPATAALYLRSLLVGSADAATLHDVVARTPRTGDTPSVAAFDNWRALAVAFADKDLDGALAVLRGAQDGAGEWAPLLAAVAVHLSLHMREAPDADPVVSTPGPAPADLRDAEATIRAEWMLFRGDSTSALEVLEGLRPENPYFAHTVEVLTGLALLLDARLEDALAWGRDHLEDSRAESDVDSLHGHAFVVSVVLLLLGRTAELREHLGSVLSTGLLSVVQRPYESGNLAIASAVALFEGRTTTAEALAHQSAALGLGPSPLPQASPTWTFARLAAGTSGFAATTESAPAGALWTEHEELLDRGYLVAAASAGALSLDLAPDPDRARALLDLLARLPARVARHVERFVEAVVTDDPDVARRAAERLLADGQVLMGARALASAVRRLRGRGDRAGVTAVLADARRLLAPFGPGAAAGLAPLAPADGLTAREREIATLVADGLSNHEVAGRLHLSVRTVENHLHRTFRKLGVEGRGDLTRALGR